MQALLAQAKRHASQGKHTEALVALDKLLSIAPSHAEARELRERVGMHCPRWWLARAFAEAESIKPAYEKAGAYAGIAEAQAMAGDAPGTAASMRMAKQAAENIQSKIFQDKSIRSQFFYALAMKFAKAGDFTGAKAYAARISDEGDKGDALATTAICQAQTGDFAGAKATAGSIAYPFSKSNAYANIALAQVKAGDVTGARRTLALAEQAARSIDDTEDNLIDFAYDVLAFYYAKAGDIPAAKFCIRVISGDSVKAHARASIASVQAAAGDDDGARQTVKAITDPYSYSSALLTVAEAHLKAGSKRQARIYFSVAESAAKDVESAHAKTDALLAVAKAYLDVSDVPAARRCLGLAETAAQGIRDNFYRCKAYCASADIAAKAQDVPRAKKDLRLARDVAESEPDTRVASMARRLLAEALVRANDVAQAKVVARDIESGFEKWDIFEAIAEAHAKAGDLSSAKATIESIKGDSQQESAYGAVAEILARSRRFAQLEQWVRDQAKPGVRWYCHYRVGKGLLAETPLGTEGGR